MSLSTNPITPSYDDLKYWMADISANEERRYELYNILIPPHIANNAKTLLTQINTLRNEVETSASITSRRKGEIRKELGGLFENFVKEVFSQCSVFNVISNAQTPTNELDFVLELTPQHNWVAFLKAHPTTQIIGEAKCYTEKSINGNWVTKIDKNMQDTNSKIGILILSNGDSIGNARLRRKFEDSALLGRYIIPLGKSFIDRTLAGENILKILEEKYNKVSRRDLIGYVL